MGGFWAQVGAKLGQVGSMLEHKPNKKGQQKNIEKLVPKDPRSRGPKDAGNPTGQLGKTPASP